MTDPGDAAFVEDPGYLGVRAALLSAGANLVYCPLDNEGIQVPQIENGMNPRLIVVSPSHQYPTGKVMTLQRRIQLLKWAERRKIWVVEDDYDSEFRYSGSPLGALQGLDRHGMVFYVGTFSKVLFPSIRLGYVVVPSSLVEKFTRGKLVLDSHPTLINQPIVAKFMEQGHFAAHVRRMRKIYERRQANLVECIEQYLSDYLVTEPSNCGMHLLARLKPVACNLPSVAWSALFLEKGLFIPSVDEYCHSDTDNGTLLLGYTSVSEKEICSGVRRMARTFNEYVT